MRRFIVALSGVCTALLLCAPAQAQEDVPAAMPFDIPYGPPISMEMAKQAVEAAHTEAVRRGWKLAIAVVSPSGDLTYFLKMDDTQLVSSGIVPNKARTAARFRRATQVFFDAMQAGRDYVATLDPVVVASPGGIPIIVGGQLIGAIGCSGATGAQDAVVCQVGVDAIGGS